MPGTCLNIWTISNSLRTWSAMTRMNNGHTIKWWITEMIVFDPKCEEVAPGVVLQRIRDNHIQRRIVPPNSLIQPSYTIGQCLHRYFSSQDIKVQVLKDQLKGGRKLQQIFYPSIHNQPYIIILNKLNSRIKHWLCNWNPPQIPWKNRFKR